MQILLVAIVVAFLGWFAIPSGEQVRVVVDVDGERVLQPEFGERYRVASQLAGGKLTDEEDLQLQSELKQEIARELVVEHEAQRQGYFASPQEMRSKIKSNPRFQDRKGNFDPDRWKQAIKNSGRSKGTFEDDYYNAVLRDKLKAATALSVHVPDAAIASDYEELFRSADLELIQLDPGALPPPTPEQVETWATKNADAVQATYDRDRPGRYELTDRVELRAIRLQVNEGDDVEALTARLEGLREELVAGADFGALARRWSEDPSARLSGALGEKRVDTLLQVEREAIGDVPEGQISEVIAEEDRLSLLRVERRLPARTIPLEEVRTDIATELFRKARVERIGQEIAQAWPSGLPTDRLLELGITVRPLPNVLYGQYTPRPGQPPAALVEQVAGASVGDVLGPVEGAGLGGTRMFIAKVTALNEANRDRFDAFRTVRLRERRQAAWDGYVDALMAEADVDLGGGQVTQGGLIDEVTDFLSGVLDNG